LIDQTLSLIGGQFERVPPWLRACTAVNTGEIARLSDLPNGNVGALVEINGILIVLMGPLKRGTTVVAVT
jgi:hypothetical protein